LQIYGIMRAESIVMKHEEAKALKAGERIALRTFEETDNPEG